MSRKPSYSRRSRDTLTGGTKDVNPQFMNLVVTQTAADVFHQAAFPIPIQRLQNTGRAQVMEVLKVIWGLQEISGGTNVLKLIAVAGTLTTKSMTAGPQLVEPTCFSQYSKSSTLDIGVAGSPMEYGAEIEPFVWDCTDGAGHGILIASDNIYIQIASYQTGRTNTAQCKHL